MRQFCGWEGVTGPARLLLQRLPFVSRPPVLYASVAIHWHTFPHAGSKDCKTLGDFVASMICAGGVVGIFQGKSGESRSLALLSTDQISTAESGPRALGHRSIYADATNAEALELINERVKYRERVQ